MILQIACKKASPLHEDYPCARCTAASPLPVALLLLPSPTTPPHCSSPYGKLPRPVFHTLLLLPNPATQRSLSRLSSLFLSLSLCLSRLSLSKSSRSGLLLPLYDPLHTQSEISRIRFFLFPSTCNNATTPRLRQSKYWEDKSLVSLSLFVSRLSLQNLQTSGLLLPLYDSPPDAILKLNNPPPPPPPPLFCLPLFLSQYNNKNTATPRL